MFKKFLSLITLGLLVFGMSALAEDKPVKLVLSNVTSDSAKIAGAKFKELVEKQSNGSITVELFNDNQLGDDRAVVENTQMGDIDISVSSTSSLATMYADFYLFDAPYLFLSPEQAYKGLDGTAGQKILDGMSKIGLKGMALWENGFRNFTNSKIEVSKPADVKGMKIRTMENDIHIAAWKALGANPTPMAFSELFTALQQGTVDGEENPLGIIDSNKFYEVQKYVSLTQHVYTPYVVMMNMEKYNSLSDAQKKAVDDSMKAATKFQREESKRLEDESVERFTKAGTKTITLSKEEKDAFQKIVTDAKIFDLVKQKMEHPAYVDEMLESIK